VVRTPTFAEKRIAAFVAQGDPKNEGAIIDTNLGGGSYRFVAGNLEAQRIDKGGTFVSMPGSFEHAGIVLCEYNHGFLLIGGDLTTDHRLIVEHDVTVSGKSIGVSH
jgi:hypothetical protein